MSERRVAIFGATSAIAAEIARLLAARGDRLYLFARNAQRLASLADELADAVVGTGQGDLDDLEQNVARVARAAKALGGIDLALIAHGDLGDQLRSERELSELESILTTNLQSPASLAMAIANVLETEGRGGLAVLSSVAGDRGRPHNFTYGAAKSGLGTLLEGLRSRLRPLGIQVHELRLGPVDTPMTIHHEKNFSFSQPAPVARAIVRAIDRGVAIAYIPSWWRPVMWVVRTLPEPIFQRLRFLSAR